MTVARSFCPGVRVEAAGWPKVRGNVPDRTDLLLRMGSKVTVKAINEKQIVQAMGMSVCKTGKPDC